MIRGSKFFILLATIALAFALRAPAQECQTASDMDAATKGAIEKTALQFFDYAKNGNVGALRQNAIPSLASSFGGVESAVGGNKDNFAGAQATIRKEYVLNAVVQGQPATLPRAEFFCGVFNAGGQTPNTAGFVLNGLPQGNYAVVIADIKGGKEPLMLTQILQDQGGWKLAGFYVKATEIAGHDADWFLQRARQFKQSGATHDAWFYYLAAWETTAPVDFMSTQQLDQLGQEMQSVRPNDLPSQQKPLQLVANGKTYNVIDISAVPIGNDLDLRVRYQVPSAADSGLYQDNVNVISGIVAKYPELRQGFAAVIARAVDPTGNDYGTLMAMDKVK
jgi:hypothetical protein